METILSTNHLKEAKANSFFATIEEMNHHVSRHSEALRRGSTENDVLMFLAERPLTYPGTSWIKVKNIAGAVCKSVRTVGYALKSLEKKKIIQRIPVMRETKGGNSSNLIAILPFSPRVCRPSVSYRPSPESPVTPGDEPSFFQTESFSLEPLKQDRNIYTSVEKFAWLIECKWKDKNIQYGSSYMEKVVETLIDEHKKIRYAKKQREFRKQTRHIERPAYDWLNEPNYSHFEERVAWLDWD